MRSAARVPRMAWAADLKRVSFSNSSLERVSSCCMAFRADFDSMRTWRGLGGMALSVYASAEADRRRIDVERALGEPGCRVERVVATRRDVVRRVRVEQRRQQLN